MAFVLADRVLETSTSTGTGSFVLAGARDGYQSFTDALANGDTTYYTITDGTDWEVGLGTWTESTATLARTTILSSSNSGSAVNFGAGTKEVFISYPSGKFSEDGSRLDDNIIYNATNTNNVAGVWEATITDVTSYYDGLMVAFYPNKIDGVSSGTTFEINSLGAKTVTRPDTNETAITTHYDGTNLIFLRYVSADDYFIVHANYNTTDDYRIRYEHNVTANNSAGSGTAWHGYELLMEGIDGKFYPVTEGGSTANTNAVSTAELRVGGAMLVYLSSTDRTANTDTGSYSLYEAVRHTSMEYWNNRDLGWATAYRPWYIVATINGNGNFVLDNTSYTSFLTQDLPTSDDGKYYIHGGLMLDTYDDYRLQVNHPIYVYKNGAVREWSGYASNADQLDGNEASAFATAAQGTTADAALPKAGGTMTGDLVFGDDVSATFGAGSDLQIRHEASGNNSVIRESGSGSLYIDATNIYVRSRTFEDMARFIADGAVSFYYDNSAKLATTSSGINVTGDVTVSGNVDGKDVSTLISELSEDSSPQLGGDLDLNGNDITGNGNINTTGDITASGTFVVSGGEISMGPTTDSNRLRLLESTAQTNEVLQVQNDVGYVQVGPANTGYSHFSTDRDKFYFNKHIIVDEGIVGSYNEDLNLNRTANGTPSTTERIRITSGKTYSDQDLDVTGDIRIYDDDKLRLGDGVDSFGVNYPDMDIYHHSSSGENHIEAYNGVIYIGGGSSKSGTAKLVFAAGQGAGGSVLELNSNATTVPEQRINAAQSAVDFDLQHNGSTKITLNTSGVTFHDSYTFPTSDGSANQVLQTNGSGQLSFADASGGGGGGVGEGKALVFANLFG